MSYYPNQQGSGQPPYQGHSPAPQPPGQGYGPPPGQYQQPPQQGWNQSPMQNQQYAPPPQQGYDNRAPPPAGQGYGAPPGQYQQQQPPYGQQQQYPPPQQGYDQQYNQYNQQSYQSQPQWSQPGAPPPGAPPQGQYPPSQQQYGAPPPQQQWNQPPPGQQSYGAPPPGQQQYGAPPPGQQQWGPPPQQQWNQPPPGQYGAPPQQQYGAPLGIPSRGYGPAPIMLLNEPKIQQDIEVLFKAMKGFGTDEKLLVRVLSSERDPDRINAIRMAYETRYHKNLVEHLKKETSGNFEEALVAIAQGPLLGDVWALKEATKGMGTKEAVLNDVLVGRSNADINAIKTEYQKVHGKSLEADLKSDLSAATEQMFMIIVAAHRNEDSVPVIPQQIDQDVKELESAIGNLISKNPVRVCQILTSRNDAQIRAIAQKYEQDFRKPLAQKLKESFSGHMEDVLVLFVNRARNRALSDAEQIEEAMAGVGTKNTLLIQRVIRAHWDPLYMKRVSSEYKNKYRTDLVRRIKGETSGDYEKLLVACVE